MKRVLLWSCILVFAISSGAWATPLSDNRHIFINVANDAGVNHDLDGTKYGGPNNTYYIKADGGGLNAEWIGSSTVSSRSGSTTINTSNPNFSGSLTMNDTGGAGGGVNDFILLLSVQGPIANNFSVSIASAGLTESFGKSDFIYGPQAYKPGPGTLGTWSLLLYPGEDVNNPAYLMFIDLNQGANMVPLAVDYSFTNLYADTVAFNIYGWSPGGNQGQGISWTNNTATNGYVINDTAIAPVPVPPSLFLLAGGLGGLGMFRRNRARKG